jgi:Methyltransferase domain
MITTLRSRLLVPIETWERHLVVAQLLGRVGSVLDVGGAPRLLASLLPEARVVVANVRPPADVVFEGRSLPFADGSFDAVVSVDVVEHVPPQQRAAHIAELVRVAGTRVVACWPLGSEDHREVEEELAAWYERRCGRPHPFLAEHLRHGLPGLDETRRLATLLPGRVELRFHGDRRVAAERFRETALARSRPLGYALRRLRERPSLELEAEPTPVTNRVFVVADLAG